jgi:hypothetical protein
VAWPGRSRRLAPSTPGTRDHGGAGPGPLAA